MPVPANQSPAFEPAALVARFECLALAQGFRVETFARVAGCPLLALTRRSPGPRPRIYLSAGIHGDEPAPPLALLDLLAAGTFDPRADWFLCPLLNPAGFLAGRRENADRLDLNRDYRHLVSAEIRGHIGWLQRQPNFDLAICLHEDWEAAGFYLYELNPTGRASLADAMIDAVAPLCPIEQAAIIDGREAAAPGIIRPVHDPQLRDQWPEAIYLRAHHTTLSYTLESPSALPLAQRIAALTAAVSAALERAGAATV
jgi:predicted deacylase